MFVLSFEKENPLEALQIGTFQEFNASFPLSTGYFFTRYFFSDFYLIVSNSKLPLFLVA